MNSSSINLIKAIKNTDLWFNLAISKLRVRFIRTALGPVWEILGTAIFLLFITIIWSNLWKRPFWEFFAFLYSGYVIWKIMSTTIIESTFLFSELYANALRNMQCDPISFCLANSLKNIFILFLNFPLLLLIIFFNNTLSITGLFYFLLYLPFFFISATCISFIVGVICLKFRDLQYSIVVIMQLLFFITPVIWDAQQISEKNRFFLIETNPFYHYVEFFRSALSTGSVSITNALVIFIITILLLLIAFLTYKKTRHKLVFWIT